MIMQAFKPKTLMGLGCACAGAAGPDGVMRNLAGLGADESCMKMEFQDGFLVPVQTNDCSGTTDISSSVIGSAPVNTDVPSGAPTGDKCNTWEQYKYGVATNGKCYSYCTTDPSVYEEVGIDKCLKGGSPFGPLKLTPNVLIIGLVAVGVVILLQQ
jgi:hypothetical protein